jgi:hypothetical protein
LTKEAKQSTRDYIGITRQKALPLMLPARAADKAYVGKISLLQEQASICSRHLDYLNSLFSSLQQSAFDGML